MGSRRVRLAGLRAGQIELGPNGFRLARLPFAQLARPRTLMVYVNE